MLKTKNYISCLKKQLYLVRFHDFGYFCSGIKSEKFQIFLHVSIRQSNPKLKKISIQIEHIS